MQASRFRTHVIAHQHRLSSGAPPVVNEVILYEANTEMVPHVFNVMKVTEVKESLDANLLHIPSV